MAMDKQYIAITAAIYIYICFTSHSLVVCVYINDYIKGFLKPEYCIKDRPT